MRYLYTGYFNPFFSDNYSYENNYNEELEMKIYDLSKGLFTIDGLNWNIIEVDHL